MKRDLLMGIDIGATGIKVGLFTPEGERVATASRRNGPVQQPGAPEGYLIWDTERLWKAVCAAAREAIGQVEGPSAVKGIAVTGFGADGVPMDSAGRQLYPMISWHDSRSAGASRKLEEGIGSRRIYEVTGYHNYAINTICKILWLKENEPAVMERAHRWLMVQDYIVFRLTGEFSTECTINSTTMALDLAGRRWSREILDFVGVSEELFPPSSSPGTVVGRTTRASAKAMGVPEGVPVATGGHDCEIGALGAGVNRADTFIDITGTWEMAIATVERFEPREELFDQGIDFECHAVPGQYLCQSLMIAGGVVEWIAEQFYRGVPAGKLYETMITEAQACSPGSGGVVVMPSFIAGMGPFQKHATLGTVLGLTTATQRGQIARAVFEALCLQLRRQIGVLEGYSGTNCRALRVIGGAQKNPFWLQMKADIAGIPVEVPDELEVTLRGAALLAGVGAGFDATVADALKRLKFHTRTYQPDRAQTRRWEEAYAKAFAPIAPALAGVYKALR